MAFNRCTDNCPEASPDGFGDVEIEKFNDPDLRAHAVKHLMDEDELNVVFKDLLKMNALDVRNCKNILERKIRCPYFTYDNEILPPCRNECFPHRIYKDCGTIVTNIVMEYWRIVYSEAKSAASEPRYCCFVDQKYGPSLWMLSNNKILVKLKHLKEEHVYLMKTAHVATENHAPLRRIVAQTRNRISRRSMSGNASYCENGKWA